MILYSAILTVSICMKRKQFVDPYPVRTPFNS